MSPLSPNRSEFGDAGLRAFLRWWGRELGGLIPLGMLPNRRPASNMVWFELSADSAVFWQVSRGRRIELGRIALTKGDATDHKIAFDTLRQRFARRPVGVCLAADRVLRKAVTLPLAAAENLAQALSFELGRHTPFNASQACFDFRVVEADRRAERLRVNLSVASKQEIDSILLLLAGWGVHPQAIMVDDELMGKGDCVNLLPPGLMPAKGWRAYSVPVAMAGVSAMLLMTALGLPLWQKRTQAIATNQVMLQARLEAAVVDNLKTEQDRLLAVFNFPLQQKLTHHNPVVVLDELTRLLPDDTWLQQLDIRGNEVMMQGSTRSSSGLAGLFENVAPFEGAFFKAPLVKLPGKEERFQLTVTLQPIRLEDVLARQRAEAEKRSLRGAKG